MNVKARLMDEQNIARALTRIAHEIVERNDGAEDIILIGVRTRGVPLAYKIRDKINAAYSVNVPLGILDTLPYRDDKVLSSNRIDGTNLPCSVEGKRVILVDDVLFTGRTARAAIEAIIARGRPKCIQLAVLVDRGHRELPIRPDYVGKNVPTSLSETICVNVLEKDGEDSVVLCDIN